MEMEEVLNVLREGWFERKKIFTAIAGALGLADEFESLHTERKEALEANSAGLTARNRAGRIASQWSEVPRSAFPQSVRDRAGHVYTVVHGQRPRGSIMPFLLNEQHVPVWEEVYPEQAGELGEALQQIREMVEGYEGRAEYNRLMAEYEGSQEALEQADQAIEGFELALLKKAWDHGVTIGFGSTELTPIYGKGMAFKRGSRYHSHREPVANRPEDPPIGSPPFMNELREKMGGKPLRIHRAKAEKGEDGKYELHLGQEGRGRKLTTIPIIDGGDGPLTTVLLGFNGSHPVLKQVEDDVVSENFVLIVLNFAGGWRGSVKYELPEGAEILASGEIAQGAAGRAGGWSQHLALVPVGSEIKYTTRGGGGHQSGTRWLRIVSPDKVVRENKDERRERQAREAAERGEIQWL